MVMLFVTDLRRRRRPSRGTTGREPGSRGSRGSRSPAGRRAPRRQPGVQTDARGRLDKQDRRVPSVPVALSRVQAIVRELFYDWFEQSSSRREALFW